MNLYVLIRKTRSFKRISFENKILFFHAFILSGIIRLAILYVPFKRLKRYMGVPNNETTFEVDMDAYTIIKRVAWVVNLVSRCTPWESKCLVKAITAQRILKRNGIYSTLYLGVKKDDENNLQAHAWLRSGNYLVTGGREKSNFKEVAKFCSK